MLAAGMLFASLVAVPGGDFRVDDSIQAARSATTTQSRVEYLDRALDLLDPQRTQVFQPLKTSGQANMRRFEALAGDRGYYTKVAAFDVAGPSGVARLRRSELLLTLADRIVDAPLPSRLTPEQRTIYREELARVAQERMQTAMGELTRAEELLRIAGREKFRRRALALGLEAEAALRSLRAGAQRQPD